MSDRKNFRVIDGREVEVTPVQDERGRRMGSMRLKPVGKLEVRDDVGLGVEGHIWDITTEVMAGGVDPDQRNSKGWEPTGKNVRGGTIFERVPDTVVLWVTPDGNLLTSDEMRVGTEVQSVEVSERRLMWGDAGRFSTIGEQEHTENMRRRKVKRLKRRWFALCEKYDRTGRLTKSEWTRLHAIDADLRFEWSQPPLGRREPDITVTVIEEAVVVNPYGWTETETDVVQLHEDGLSFRKIGRHRHTSHVAAQKSYRSAMAKKTVIEQAPNALKDSGTIHPDSSTSAGTDVAAPQTSSPRSPSGDPASVLVTGAGAPSFGRQNGSAE